MKEEKYGKRCMVENEDRSWFFLSLYPCISNKISLYPCISNKISLYPCLSNKTSFTKYILELCQRAILEKFAGGIIGVGTGQYVGPK